MEDKEFQQWVIDALLNMELKLKELLMEAKNDR